MEIRDSIRQILLNEWNPIGFDVPHDEYDSYIAPIYRILAGSRSEQELIEFLFRTERDIIGIACNSPEQLRLLAHRFMEIDVRF